MILFSEGPVVTPPPRPPANIPSIKVVINTPQIKIVEIGETTEFNCNGYFILNNVKLYSTFYVSFSSPKIHFRRQSQFAGTNTTERSPSVSTLTARLFSSKTLKLMTAACTFAKLKAELKSFATTLLSLSEVSSVYD